MLMDDVEANCKRWKGCAYKQPNNEGGAYCFSECKGGKMKAYNGITKPDLEEIIQKCDNLTPGQKDAFDRYFSVMAEFEERNEEKGAVRHCYSNGNIAYLCPTCKCPVDHARTAMQKSFCGHCGQRLERGCKR